MACPEADVSLEEGALLIAAHAHPSLVLPDELGRLDDLAHTCTGATLEAVARHLFIDLGFTGDHLSYHDPRNSYLDDVLRTRRGIPISLSTVAIAVCRRLGVSVDGIGMPGHFLLRDGVEPETFIDPFDHGRRLDRQGCMALFHEVQGPEAAFDHGYLEPVGTFNILARILANLRAVFAATDDRHALLWVLRLRSTIPGVPVEERAELASALAAVGHIREAASQFDQLAEALGGDIGSGYSCNADRLRARLN